MYRVKQKNLQLQEFMINNLRFEALFKFTYSLPDMILVGTISHLVKLSLYCRAGYQRMFKNRGSCEHSHDNERTEQEW